MKSKKTSYWVVVSAYQEEASLHDFLTGLVRVTNQVVLVDDGSSDASGEIASKFPIYLLTHEVNLGKGAAMKTGADYVFEVLGGDAVVFMDGDGQHATQDLQKFFTELDKGSQVVLGVRKNVSPMAHYRRFGSRIAGLLTTVLFGVDVPDITSGFKAFTRKSYVRIRWDALRYEVEIEIAARLAKYKMPYAVVAIETIYNEKEHQMNLIDVVNTFFYFVLLRIRL